MPRSAITFSPGLGALTTPKVGSGNSGSPWPRIHFANATARRRWLSEACTGPPRTGANRLHAFCAAWNAGDRGLTPDWGLI